MARRWDWAHLNGFIWWVVGSLTLFPILVGTVPNWSADAVAGTFPSLVGHLMYRGSGGDAPRDGGRPQPLVEYPTIGRHGTGGAKATAGAYSRSCPVDSGGSDGPDALHASRLRRFERRPSAFGILTGDDTEGANHASNLPWRAVGNEKSC